MCNVQRLRPCRLIGASLLSYIVQFTLFLLGFDGEGGVGDGAEAVLGDELAGDAADAVGLVVNARQGALQFLYELLLAGHEALDLGTLGVRRALVEDVVELANLERALYSQDIKFKKIRASRPAGEGVLFQQIKK